MKSVGLFVLALSVAQPACADRLNVDPVTDGIILAGGAAAAGLSELLLPSLPTPWGSLGAADIGTVNGLDRAAMFPYSHGFDLASTILEYSSVAAGPFHCIHGEESPELPAPLAIAPTCTRVERLELTLRKTTAHSLPGTRQSHSPPPRRA
jgi:hypothetical protein